MPREITGLDAYGLSPSALARLGSRSVQVLTHLATYDLTPAVVRQRPADRRAFLGRRVNRWLQTARERWPSGTFRITSDTALPSTLTATVHARDVKAILGLPGVASIHVSRIRGLRRRPERRDPDSWYCVRATVAIQVEAQERGFQTIEDRFVLVKAESDRHAVRRLRREWREYAAPYMNPDDYLVRWQLERVTEVYELFEHELDPNGVEVFSRLGSRRMRREFEWHPRRRRLNGRAEGLQKSG